MDLAQNLADVRTQIADAARRANRDAGEITLVAVSKTHPVELLQAALAAGAADFGENRVQEAATKVDVIGQHQARWHLIGNLQANKARKAVKTFDLIHTLDSVDLARRLNRICVEESRDVLEVLIQVDLAGEATKSGVDEKELPALVETVRNCERLKLRGLMIIPPFADDAELTRPYFRGLRELRDKVFGDERAELSMGMSHDFHIAIEESAAISKPKTKIKLQNYAVTIFNLHFAGASQIDRVKSAYGKLRHFHAILFARAIRRRRDADDFDFGVGGAVDFEFD